MALVPNKSPIDTNAEHLIFLVFLESYYCHIGINGPDTVMWCIHTGHLNICVPKFRPSGEGLESITLQTSSAFCQGHRVLTHDVGGVARPRCLWGSLRVSAVPPPLLLESFSQSNTSDRLRALPAGKTGHPCNGFCCLQSACYILGTGRDTLHI